MNAYDKLRPCVDIEKRNCDVISSIVLVDILTDNPIHYLDCKNEIDPEILGLSEKLVDEIANWFQSYLVLYEPCLNSEEYEQCAKEKLINKNGQVSVEEMRVANKLSEFYPTY